MVLAGDRHIEQQNRMGACMLSQFSCVQLSAHLWTVILQAALSVGQEYWISLTLGSNPRLMSPALAGGFFTSSATWKVTEQKRQSQQELILIWAIDLQQKMQEHIIGKGSLFGQWCWETGQQREKEWNLSHFLTPYTKINSKWIKDLNLRPGIIKLLEENIASMCSGITTQYFFGMSPLLMFTQIKPNKWDYIKLKSFCTAKETTNKTKRQPAE